eukprot:4470132-Heterocapsa_arctica.AAC.1
MKTRIERTREEAPRQLALPERRERMNVIQLKPRGMGLQGELEVSHALVDICVAISDDNRLKYVEWQ